MKIIAIDGPAGAGKGTISNFLCEKLNYLGIDTGLFYRFLGLKVARDQILEKDLETLEKCAQSITLKELNDPILRDEKIASFASKIAVIPSVRKILTETIQKNVFSLMGKTDGVVADGRDVASVIFPNADLKLFITASEEVRAKRRAVEMSRAKEDISSMLKKRDERDQKRKASPLKPVDDAFTIDTSLLSIEEMQHEAYTLIKSKLFN